MNNKIKIIYIFVPFCSYICKEDAKIAEMAAH